MPRPLLRRSFAFEQILQSYGVSVKHYHADNGLFDTKVFKAAIAKASQTLTFCGVNAHHQNGKAENRIKDVTQGARTALLHAASNAGTDDSASNHCTLPVTSKPVENRKITLYTIYTRAHAHPK